MKTIKLTQDKVALVDDDVYEWASQFKWHAQKRNYRFYAARGSPKDSITGKRRLIYLHREIMKAGPDQEVDHRFGKTLDNRVAEMRLVTRAQNKQAFRKPKENTSSKFRGVHWFKRHLKWMVQIHKGNRRIYLGYFTEEVLAARAYDKAARELFGEFAQLNFP